MSVLRNVLVIGVATVAAWGIMIALVLLIIEGTIFVRELM